MTPLLATLLMPCLQAPAPGAERPANGESFALFQGLHASGRLHISVPSGPCEAAANRLAMRLQGLYEVSVAPAERDPGAVRVLVGAPTDPELLPCVTALGLEPLVGGFRMLGRDYTRPGDALQAVIADPLRAGRPLYLVVGNDLELLATYLDGIPRLSRPHLWLHADGELALECPLPLDGRAPTADAPGLCDYVARRAQYFEGGWTSDTEGLVVHAHGALERERWRAYGLALARVQRRVAGWFGAESVPACELFLYEHLEDFERCVGTSALSLANRLRPRLQVLLAPGMPDDGGAGFARVLARALAGAPAEDWLEDGLGVAAAGVWWRRPLDGWIQHLSTSKQLPVVTEICAPLACERFSEHALLPARALLFREAVQGADERRVLALWKGAPLEPQMAAALYKRGVSAAQPDAPQGKGKGKGKGKDKGNDNDNGGAGTPAAVARERRRALPSFRHGLALVEDEHARYSGRAVEEVIAEARALEPGPDALSLTVFATTEDPLPPLCPARAQSVFGSAGDLALASVTGAARTAELGLLLSLEVLARPTGAWADVLSWTGADEQGHFWARYEEVAEHYALLSELLGFEYFSFASNLSELVNAAASGEEPDAEELAERRAKWTKLIERLRRAYAGGLVFTARSPAEAEGAGFLEELDAIGLFLYPRLRAASAPEQSELERVLRYELGQAIDLGLRWNKPVLLVQVGFPSRADSWAQPLVPRGALDLGAQQRYFETLADVLAQGLENKKTLAGFFLWNWPLAAESAGALDAGFSLRQKPVEAALRRLFAR